MQRVHDAFTCASQRHFPYLPPIYCFYTSSLFLILLITCAFIIIFLRCNHSRTMSSSSPSIDVRVHVHVLLLDGFSHTRAHSISELRGRNVSLLYSTHSIASKSSLKTTHQHHDDLHTARSVLVSLLSVYVVVVFLVPPS